VVRKTIPLDGAKPDSGLVSFGRAGCIVLLKYIGFDVQIPGGYPVRLRTSPPEMAAGYDRVRFSPDESACSLARSLDQAARRPPGIWQISDEEVVNQQTS